jgi:WD40 repeat protein
MLLFGRGRSVVLAEVPSGREGGRVTHRGAGMVVDVAVTPNGRRAASLGDDGTVAFWSLPGLRPEGAVLQLGVRTTGALALSPDGHRIACNPAGGSLRVFDARTGRRVLEARWSSAGAFSPDGTALAAGGIYRVRVWDARTGRMRKEDVRSEGVTVPIGFAPDGRSFYAVVNCGKPHYQAVQRLDVASLAEIRDFVVASGEITDGHIRGAALSGDGRLLATLASGNDEQFPVPPFTLWDTTSGEKLFRAAGGTVPSSAALSRTGAWLATRSGPQIQVWSVRRA